MKAVAKTVAKERHEMEDKWFAEASLEGWSKRNELYQVLKAKTSGEGQQVVLGAEPDDGNDEPIEMNLATNKQKAILLAHTNSPIARTNLTRLQPSNAASASLKRG